MPTFAASALDRLIEADNTRSMALVRNSLDTEIQTKHPTSNPRVYKSIDVKSTELESRVSNVPTNSNILRGVSVPSTRTHERKLSLPSIPVPHRTNGSSASGVTVVKRKDYWTDISPSLYATPESTPLPDSPSSLSPSPYIINHKRRGRRLMKSFSEENASFCKQSTRVINSEENGTAAEDDISKPVEALDCATNGTSEQNVELKPVENVIDSDLEDFLDPNDSVSVSSFSESEGYPVNSAMTNTEFFDAWEELSSENGNQLSTPPRTETELRGMMSLLMEIDKRKQAEETLNNMTKQWRRIRDQLSDVGIRLPEDPSGDESTDSITNVCEQVFISRFVSESIGRGLARAEVEMEKEAQIRTKNIEIARLCDKLRYYEAVNSEMSQRNQEIVETTRQIRQRRKRRHKWIWSSIAIVTVTLVTTSLAYSYFSSETPAPEQNSTE